RLTAREAEGEELLVGRLGEARGGGEGVRVAGALAEALDQPVADREGGEERDLLRGDRGDDRLEWVRRDRRAEPGEAADELPEHGIARREGVERLQVELEPEEPPHDRPGPPVQPPGVRPP